MILISQNRSPPNAARSFDTVSLCHCAACVTCCQGRTHSAGNSGTFRSFKSAPSLSYAPVADVPMTFEHLRVSQPIAGHARFGSGPTAPTVSAPLHARRHSRRSGYGIQVFRRNLTCGSQSVTQVDNVPTVREPAVAVLVKSPMTRCA